MRDGSASSNNASSKLDEVYLGSEVYSEHSAHIQLKLSLVPLQVAREPGTLKARWYLTAPCAPPAAMGHTPGSFLLNIFPGQPRANLKSAGDQ